MVDRHGMPRANGKTLKMATGEEIRKVDFSSIEVAVIGAGLSGTCLTRSARISIDHKFTCSCMMVLYAHVEDFFLRFVGS